MIRDFPVHIYIHLPFCVKKCRYCDFYSTETLSLIQDFVPALIEEIRLRSNPRSTIYANGRGEGIKTIYFGGGTPSLLPLEGVEAILTAISDGFHLSQNTEITFEVNPGTLDQSYFSGLKSLGVNRLSMGIQSFDDEKLKFLGRIHSGTEAGRAIDQARRAGFDNLSLDLIYATPKESKAFWFGDLEKALSHFPEHLSCYMLTLEPHTPLYSLFESGKLSPMPGTDQVDMFLATSQMLTRKGYLHYEISNFAREKRLVSQHNSAYWQMRPYMGFGPSAHSFESAQGRFVRSWNLSDVNAYISFMDKQGPLPLKEREELSLSQQMLELILVGLRTVKGIDIKAFDSLSDIPFKKRYKGLLQVLSEQGLGELDREGDWFSLSRAGWARLDSIVEEFADQLI